MCYRIGTPLHALLSGVGILSYSALLGLNFLVQPRRSFSILPSVRRYRVRSVSPMRGDLRSELCRHLNSVERYYRFPNGNRQLYSGGGEGVPVWMEPLIHPSTAVNEDCIQALTDHLNRTKFKNRSVLDAIFKLSSKARNVHWVNPSCLSYPGSAYGRRRLRRRRYPN
jgi:hypothetical protein